MPLYKTLKPDKDTVIHVWQIEESLAWLSRGIDLTSNCRHRVDGMKSELHQRGFMSIRHLLAIEGYKDHDLYYDRNGKPHLRDGQHISITHSFTFSAIIIGNKEVGIDIEKQRPKILRIAHKFTNPSEYPLQDDEVLAMRKLTVVWGAKESLYKSFAQPGISFRNHINVYPFEMEDNETYARVSFNGKSDKYRVWFEEFEGFTCAYAIID